MFDTNGPVVDALITFVAVAVAGGLVAYWYGIARHRRELELEALGRFFDVYGRWFATWKEWQAIKKNKDSVTRAEDRATLSRKATEVEGEFEALLVRIATSRRLDAGQADRLGRFREGYQRLRECIEEDQPMPWRVSVRDDEINAQCYLTFKSLSVEFASLLDTPRAGRWRRTPSLRQAQETFIRVSSWRAVTLLKDDWWTAEAGRSLEEAVEAWKALPRVHPKKQSVVPEGPPAG